MVKADVQEGYEGIKPGPGNGERRNELLREKSVSENIA